MKKDDCKTSFTILKILDFYTTNNNEKDSSLGDGSLRCYCLPTNKNDK